MKLLILFSGWLRRICLSLPLERRMWFITKEWRISQDGTRLQAVVMERSASSRQCFAQSWKRFRTVLQQGEIQAPLTLIPKLLLTSPEPSFPLKNPSVYFSSLTLCFNSDVFPTGLEIERKRKGSEGVWERQESKPPSPIPFMGWSSWLYPQASTSPCSSLPFALTGLIPSVQRSPQAAHCLSLVMLYRWHFLLSGTSQVSQQHPAFSFTFRLSLKLLARLTHACFIALRPQVKWRWWFLFPCESCWRSSLQVGLRGALAEASY